MASSLHLPTFLHSVGNLYLQARMFQENVEAKTETGNHWRIAIMKVSLLLAPELSD